MSTNAPLKSIQDGLVFYYDTNNPKSYNGQPTVNLNSDPLALGGNPGSVSWGGYEYNITRTSDLPVSSMREISPFWLKCVCNGPSSGRAAVLGVGGLSTGVDYCISSYVYSDDADITTVTWVSHNSGISVDYSAVTYGSSDRSTVKRIYRIFRSVAGSQLEVLQTNSNVTAGDTFYITGIQCEQKSYPTQLVNGTRSNTQGLLDLTKRYTIDLTNAGFDSNANITFNQPSNYTIATNIPITSLPALSDFTFEIWFNPTAYPTVAPANQYNNTTRCGVLFGATYYCGTALYWYGNSSGNAFTIYSYIRGTDSYRTTAGYNLTLNKYHHLVLVHSYTAGKLRLYVNGTLYSEVQGATAQYDSNLTGTAGNIGVSKAQVDGGGEANYSHITGQVGEAKIYTKALSSDEVSQNYYRSKSRYRL